MPKKSTVFFCSECGFESAKWLGQCPGCKSWNTFVEEPVRETQKVPGAVRKPGAGRRTASSLGEISLEDRDRLPSGMAELDRVLGGGIVQGSLVLVGGDPGIGKSTILLQVCRSLAERGTKVLYISGEESLKQIKMRAVRLGAFAGDVRMAAETNLADIRELIEAEKPEVVVVDSIQTLYREDVSGAPGSVSQVRECANVLLQVAKTEGIAVFLVGHVTKEGTVAGPRVLEHMVDTVLYFEGDRSQTYRLIRAVKNRFGATNEVGVFEMTAAGLAEVTNPSDYLVTGRPEDASGSALSCVMEGTRPMLMEVQALVCRTAFGLPRRTAVGIDLNRVNLLTAVLEKRGGLSLASYDVYVSITGGMRISDPSMDLAVLLALVSGYFDIPLSGKNIAFGEAGLAGEIRGVSNVNARVKEAVRLGYTQAVIPRASMHNVEKEYRPYCIPVSTVREAIRLLPGGNPREGAREG
ncbi:MAG: DNA repair protein RadA [Lachnospiraceae bacterium]|nr:DNA repair protein RadA [Lachnospiraceae bacterium]